MKLPKILFLALIVIFVIGACSNRAIYNNFQINNRNDCAKQPESQYEECMERSNMSYEEYERKRKEPLGK